MLGRPRKTSSKMVYFRIYESVRLRKEGQSMLKYLLGADL